MSRPRYSSENHFPFQCIVTARGKAIPFGGIPTRTYAARFGRGSALPAIGLSRTTKTAMNHDASPFDPTHDRDVLFSHDDLSFDADDRLPVAAWRTGAGSTLACLDAEPSARDLRRFACSMCHKTFTRNRDVARHQLIHLGVRPFVCEACGKRFTQSGSLKLHRRKLHENL